MAARRARATTKKKKGKGQKAFVATVEQRESVEKMVGMHLTYREIATVIYNPDTGKGISTRTLQDHFVEELERGRAKMKAEIYASCYRRAFSKHGGSTTMLIWITKTQFGWQERVHHDVDTKSGVLVVPASQTPAEWLKAQEINGHKNTKGKKKAKK